MIAELTGLPIQEAYAALGDVAEHPLKRRERRGKLVMPDGVGDLTSAHEDYLYHRGFDPSEISQLWKVRGIAGIGKLKWRLFIPIRQGTETVSWTTRAICDGVKAKYINARPEQEAVPAKSLLYGEEYARGSVIVVEGPTDCWAVGPGAVATMGLSCTKAQILRISKYAKRCICFDNSPDAQRRAERLAVALSILPGETLRCELNAPDPGSASEREIERLRRVCGLHH
jgi:hypothetical protein